MVNSIAIVCLRLPSTGTDCYQQSPTAIVCRRRSLIAIVCLQWPSVYFRFSWDLFDRYPLSSVIFVCILLSWTIFNSSRLLSIDLD